jgi:GTP-binding protein
LIESFLLDNPRLRGLVQIIDARLGVTENDHIMFEFLKNVPFQTLIVATKADKLKKNEIIKQETAIQKQLEFYSLQNWLFFSAKTKLGKREVWHWISNRISQ